MTPSTLAPPRITPTRQLALVAVSLFVSTFVSDGKLAKLPLQFLRTGAA